MLYVNDSLCGAPQPEKPMRIVVFPLFAEEILLDMIGPERIVYVGHKYWENGEGYSPTMPLTKNIPGRNWQNSDEEHILSLNPDLIILEESLIDVYIDNSLYPLLARAQIPVFFVRWPDDIQGTMNNILLLGDAVHAPRKARQMVDIMKNELMEIKNALLSLPTTAHMKAVYYEVWQEEFSLMADICALSSLYWGNSFVKRDDAQIADWNPDIIFFQPTQLDTDGSILSVDESYAQHKADYILNNPALIRTSAVKKSSIYPINLHSSHYIIDSIKEIIRYAYPGLSLTEGN